MHVFGEPDTIISESWDTQCHWIRSLLTAQSPLRHVSTT